MSGQLRFCPYCGSPVIATAQRFCGNCGRSLAEPAGTEPANAESAPDGSVWRSPNLEAQRTGVAASGGWQLDAEPVVDPPPASPMPPAAELATPTSGPFLADSGSPMAGLLGSARTVEASALPGAATPATGLRSAHWTLGAAAALGVAVLLPWITFFSLSMSPLQLMNQSGYWLLVIGVAVAAIVLAIVTISSPEREASRALWAWLWITFGGAVLLSALLLVSFASASSQGGLTGALAGSAGIGLGYLLYAAASVSGAVVALRAWRSQAGTATASAAPPELPARVTDGRPAEDGSPDAPPAPAPSNDAFATVRTWYGRPEAAPVDAGLPQGLAPWLHPSATPPASPPAGAAASTSQIGPTVLLVGGLVLMVVLAAAFMSQSSSRSDVLAMVGTACNQATAWQNDSHAGSTQASSDQSALYTTLQQLATKMQSAPVSAQAQSELSSLTMTVQMGIFDAPDAAVYDCQTLQAQLQQDVGSQGANP